MGDLTRIDAATLIEITDGVSQSVGVTTGLPGTSAVGLVVREARQGQAAMSDSVPVVIASNQSTLTIFGSVDFADTNTQADLDMSSLSNAVQPQCQGNTAVLVSGTWTGALSFQSSLDDTTWTDTYLQKIDDLSIYTATTSSNGTFAGPSAAYGKLRVKVSSTGTGTAVVYWRTTPATGFVRLSGPIPPGTSTIGTVTAVPTGTQAVSGTITVASGTVTFSNTSITTVPSGTQPISGTVTAVPTGTQTVAGSVTIAPSGTQTVTGGGTAGTAATGVITVQGIAGATAVKVDGSAVTQPVSGTVTNVPSGTQTVTGTITNVPSGTQTVGGTVTIVPSGTQTISGTVATNADANIAAGTAPSKALIGGLVYNTSTPTLTNGQTIALQGDVSGNLKVALSSQTVTIASGTVAFSNTSITTVPSGTQTVAGTVTNVPSGTQTVGGTVTAVPTGTQAVSGTITNVPSGTQTITGTVDTELPAAAALADTASATPTCPTVGAISLLMNASTVDRQRAIVNTLDSNGIGIAAAGLVAQLDDSGTSTVTENQFAPVRLSSRRALLVEGVASGTSLPINGTVTVASGTLAFSNTSITTVPSGTQTVSGTITNVPSGTQAVSGTVTNVPSGTQTITGTVDTELPAAAALADTASATPTCPTVGAINLLMNASTVDRQRAVVNSLDSTGQGIAAAGLVAQLDDSGTSTVTENQFAVVRLSSRRALLVEGVASGTAQPISGTITVASGTITFSNTSITTVPSGTQTVTGSVSVSSGSIAVTNTVTVAGSGTAGTAVAGVVTVQGIAGMTAVKVDGSAVTQPVSGTITVASISSTVTTKYVTSSSATSVSQTSVTTTASTLLASNSNRKRFAVQNTGTTLIKLGFGGTPTSTAYHVCLSACSAADDGTGGFYLDEMWTGTVVGICSGAGTVVVTELT